MDRYLIIWMEIPLNGRLLARPLLVKMDRFLEQEPSKWTVFRLLSTLICQNNPVFGIWSKKLKKFKITKQIMSRA